MTTTTIDLDLVVRYLHEEHRLEDAYVEQTGGGVATIYAGLSWEDPAIGTRWSAIAGPGSFSYTAHSTADLAEFYVGPDDQGESEPLAAADLGITTEEQAARLIAAQAQSPNDVLGVDAVEALGLDGTGRGLPAGDPAPRCLHENTTWAVVGAPGYGRILSCVDCDANLAGHVGILTEEDVR